MNELQSKEIYDSAGNVIPEIAELSQTFEVFYLVKEFFIY